MSTEGFGGSSAIIAFGAGEISLITTGVGVGVPLVAPSFVDQILWKTAVSYYRMYAMLPLFSTLQRKFHLQKFVDMSLYDISNILFIGPSCLP